MTGRGLDAGKDELIDAVTEAYARGAMETAAFERAVARITAAADPAALAVETAALGIALPQAAAAPGSGASPLPHTGSEDLVELACVSGNIKENGEWVRASRYRLYLKSSNCALDLLEYEGRPGFRLLIELDLISSNLRIVVPEGFEIDDRIAERRSSTIRNKPKSEIYDDCVVTLAGSLRSSNLKIKYK